MIRVYVVGVAKLAIRSTLAAVVQHLVAPFHLELQFLLALFTFVCTSSSFTKGFSALVSYSMVIPFTSDHRSASASSFLVFRLGVVLKVRQRGHAHSNSQPEKNVKKMVSIILRSAERHVRWYKHSQHLQ